MGGRRSAVRPARQGGRAAAGASVGNVSGPYPGVRLAGSGLLSNQYRRSLHLDTSFSYAQYSTLEHDDFIPSFSGTSDPQHSCLIFRNTARKVAIINDIRLPDRVKLHLPKNTLLSIRKRKRHSASLVFFYSQITVFDFTKLIPVVNDLYFCDFPLVSSVACLVQRPAANLDRTPAGVSTQSNAGLYTHVFSRSSIQRDLSGRRVSHHILPIRL